MFRFSLRELFIVSLAAALGIAWLAEHRMRVSAEAGARLAQREAAVWQSISESREQETQRICDQLQARGLEVLWACGHGVSIPIVSDANQFSN